MTGTYADRNGVVPTLSASIGAVTQQGTVTGTWRWSFPTTNAGDTQGVTISATDSAGLTGTGGFQLTVLAEQAPVLSTAASEVIVISGEAAANSGTYLNASGSTPTLTADQGTVTQTGGATGTWTWSRPTDASYAGGTVTVSAAAGGLVGATAFDVIVQTATTSVSSSANPSFATEAITFTATVSSAIAGLAPPTGTVQFQIDGADAGTAVALVNGVASLTVPAPAIGGHAVHANYSGDSVHRPSSGAMTQTVVDVAMAQGNGWVRQFGTEQDDQAGGVATDAAGNVYTAGVWNGHAFLRKLDYAGAEQWSRVFASGAGEIAHGVAVDAAGRVSVVGETSGDLPGQVSAGGADAFVRQYSADGTELWTRQFGSTVADAARGVAIDADGRISIVGTTDGQLPGETNSGGVDAFVRQYDSAGSLVWSRQFGTNTTDELVAVATDGRGRVVATGYTGGAFLGEAVIGIDDAIVVMLDARGTVQWVRQFGSSFRDRGHGIAVDGDGGIYATGTSEGLPGIAGAGGVDAFLRKYDVLGVEQWTRQFGSSNVDSGDAVTVDANGTAIVVGTTYGALPGFTNAGELAVFVQRVSSDGVAGAAWQGGTATNDWAGGIATDPVGNVNLAGYTAGQWAGQTAGGPLSSGLSDAFVVHLVDPAGPVVQVQPQAQSVRAGDSVAFSARAGGAPLPSVQWQVSVDGGTTFSDVAGATAFEYAFAAGIDQDDHQYRAVFTNVSGTATSDAARLTVGAAPILLTADDDETVAAGVAAAVNGTYSDPNNLTPDLVASIGTITVNGDGTWMWSMVTTAPLSAQPVTITATDVDGATGTVTFHLTVLPDTEAPRISLVAADADTVFVQSPSQLRVSATDALGVASVTINGASASLVSGSAVNGVWAVSAAVSLDGATTLAVDAVDVSGNSGSAALQIDGDGIAGSLDADAAYSSDFHNGLTTTGTILDRAGWSVRIDSADFAVRARLGDPNSHGGAARIQTCSSHIQVVLNQYGEQASWLCNASGTIALTAEVATPSIEVRKDICDPALGCLFTISAQVPAMNRFFTGSPSRAAADNDAPIALAIIDASGATVGSFMLDPGESADVTPRIGAAGEAQVELSVITGEVTFTIGAKSLTLSSADAPVAIATSDIAAPVVGTVDDVIAEATSAAGAAVVYALPAVADDFDPAPVVTATPASGSVFPLGRTLVSINAVDAAGHSSSATFAVTVRDTTPPLITTTGDVTAEAVTNAQTGGGTRVSALSATATDLVDGGPTPADCQADTNTLFPVGVTQVLCTSTDAHGNVGTATITVTIVDTTPPHVLTSGDVTIEARSTAGEIFTFDAVGVDIVDVGVAATCAPVSGTRFPLGATTVTCTATDDAGNTGTASFTVTVADTTAPAFTLPAPLVIESPTGAGMPVSFEASALDLLDGARPVICAPASGSTVPLGTTTVVCTSSDTRDNTATGEFMVTVIDRTVPVVTTSGDVTVEAVSIGATPVSFSASATDLLDGPLPVDCFPASGHGFGIGTTTVTCTATDPAGNAGSATLDVSVTDTTPPVITLPPAIAVGAAALSGTAVTYMVSAIDLGIDVTPQCEPASGSVFPIGRTMVRCTAVDRTGNTATGTFTVTVTAPPPIIAPVSNVSAEATSAAGATVLFTLPVAADSLDPAPVVTASPAAGSIFPIGNTPVTITAASATGQVATTTFTVTVRDTTAPALLLPAPMVVEASGSDGAIVIFSVTATDAVSAVTTVCSPASGTAFPIGTTTVNCTATDAAGNAAAGAFTVEVADPPTPGRMHGEGHVMSGPILYDFNFSVVEIASGRSSGWFKLQVCQPAPPKNRGRARDGDEHERCIGGSSRFAAVSLTDGRFSNAPSFAPGRGRAQASLNDTVMFSGTGSWNGAPGYRYEVRATDRGEPGIGHDEFEVTIRTPNGDIVAASARGTLTAGNIQSTPGFNPKRALRR
jgi:hypothetical protein